MKEGEKKNGKAWPQGKIKLRKGKGEGDGGRFLRV